MPWSYDFLRAFAPSWHIWFKLLRIRLIPQRFPLLQHMLDTLQRLFLAAQFQERLPLQVQQVLLGDQGPGRNIAPRDDIGNRVGEELLELRYVSTHLHVPDLGLNGRGNAPARRLQVDQRFRRTVVRGQRNSLLLG